MGERNPYFLVSAPGLVRIRLGADQRTVQPHGDLLDDGVSQVVGDPQCVGCAEVISIVYLHSQLHGKVTATQIHVVVQSRHQKFHGIDARGEGIDGDHAVPTEADSRLGYLKTIAIPGVRSVRTVRALG